MKEKQVIKPKKKKAVPAQKTRVYTVKEILAFKAHALELWKEDNSHAKELGLALLQLRAALRSKHGAFKLWWQSYKLSQARVSYCMRLAQGKITAPMAKQPSAFKGAAGVAMQIRKDVNDFSRFVINFDPKKEATPVFDGMVKLVGDITLNISKLPGWGLPGRDNSPAFELHQKAFQKSLHSLMQYLFTGKSPLTSEKKPMEVAAEAGTKQASA